MNNVEFEEDMGGNQTGGSPKIMYARIEASSRTPAMVSFLIKKGFVKSEKAAQIILLVVILACIIIGYFAYHYYGGTSTITLQEALESMQQTQ
jgi:hypothetical protein